MHNKNKDDQKAVDKYLKSYQPILIQLVLYTAVVSGINTIKTNEGKERVNEIKDLKNIQMSEVCPQLRSRVCKSCNCLLLPLQPHLNFLI